MIAIWIKLFKYYHARHDWFGGADVLGRRLHKGKIKRARIIPAISKLSMSWVESEKISPILPSTQKSKQGIEHYKIINLLHLQVQDTKTLQVNVFISSTNFGSLPDENLLSFHYPFRTKYSKSRNIYYFSMKYFLLIFGSILTFCHCSQLMGDEIFRIRLKKIMHSNISRGTILRCLSGKLQHQSKSFHR